MASLKAAAAAAKTGVHGASATGPGADANLWGAEATAVGNSRGLSLPTTQSFMRGRKESMMSSEDHEIGDSWHAAYSDALPTL